MLLDAHTHLDMYDAAALDAAIREIEQHRILTVAVAMDPASYARTQAIAARSDLIIPTFGVHPWEAPQWADRLDALDPLIATSRMLGEIGLDYHWVEDASAYPAQRRVFEHFLAAARDRDAIVNLHTKGAEAEVCALLRAYRVRRAIVHWYSGPLDVLDDLLALGATFTVGVEVCHSDAIRAVAARIPPDRLLTETDNPGGLEWLTGERGMPRHVLDVVGALAALHGTDADAIQAQVWANWARLWEG